MSLQEQSSEALLRGWSARTPPQHPEKQAVTSITPLASIDIDIGKEVFHLVAFGTDGKMAFRRKIKRPALVETSNDCLQASSAWRPVTALILSAGRYVNWVTGLGSSLRSM
jgi:hypothetical protein